MSKKEKVKSFVKKHRKEIVIAATATAGIIACVVGFKAGGKNALKIDADEFMKKVDSGELGLLGKLIQTENKSSKYAWDNESDWTLADLGNCGKKLIEDAMKENVNVTPETKITGVLVYVE